LVILRPAVLRKVNRGGFSFDEINDLPDYCGPELEIMLHRHEFEFSRLALPFRPNILKGAKSVSWKGLAAELAGGDLSARAPLPSRRIRFG